MAFGNWGVPMDGEAPVPVAPVNPWERDWRTQGGGEGDVNPYYDPNRAAVASTVSRAGNLAPYLGIPDFAGDKKAEYDWYGDKAGDVSSFGFGRTRYSPANLMTGYYDQGQGFKSGTGYNYYQDYKNQLNKPFEQLNDQEKAQLYKYWQGDRSSITGGNVFDKIGKEFGRAESNVRNTVKSGIDDVLPLMTLGLGGTSGAKETYKQYEPALMAAGAYMGGTALANLAGGLGGGVTPLSSGADIAGLQGAEAALTGGGVGGWAGTQGAGTMAGLGLTDYLSLAGGLSDMYGQYQAGEAQQDANAQAAARAREAAQYATGAYAPYAQLGAQGLAGLGAMGSYDPTTDPQYQNQLAEMSRLMDARSAATGMGQSSADLKQRAALGSDLYGQAYNREYNRLGDLTGLGQYGTTGSVNAMLGQGQTLGNLALQGGQVQANQLAGLYGGLGQAFQLPAMTQQQNLQNQQQQQLQNAYIAMLNRS